MAARGDRGPEEGALSKWALHGGSRFLCPAQEMPRLRFGQAPPQGSHGEGPFPSLLVPPAGASAFSGTSQTSPSLPQAVKLWRAEGNLSSPQTPEVGSRDRKERLRIVPGSPLLTSTRTCPFPARSD